MGKKSDAPPAPNYAPLIAASMAQTQHANDLADEQFHWAKEQYASDKATSDKVAQSMLDTQKQNAEYAAKDRARYESTFQPLEDNLVKEANDYASPARKDQAIGAAQAGVAQKFDAARASNERDLEAYGVNPGAVRFGALDLSARTQQAAAQAAAGTQAGLQVDATGRALRSEAINVGRGYPGQVAGESNTGLQAGTGAVNTGLSTTASGANTMGTAPGYTGMAMQGVGQTANITDTGYKNQLAAFDSNQKASSGAGALLGAAAGIGAKAFLGPSMPWVFAAEGGAIEQPGAAVPVEASPTGGAAIDDVSARLTPGEFVVPKDAASWLGEEKLQKMILKARQDKQKAGAKPAVGPAPARPPTFQSRSAVGGGALPVG